MTQHKVVITKKKKKHDFIINDYQKLEIGIHALKTNYNQLVLSADISISRYQYAYFHCYKVLNIFNK